MGTFRFEVEGRVVEEGTGKALRGLLVRAYDQDVVFDDLLGEVRTAEDGGFRIQFTKHAVRRDARARESFEIRLPAQPAAR